MLIKIVVIDYYISIQSDWNEKKNQEDNPDLFKDLKALTYARSIGGVPQESEFHSGEISGSSFRLSAGSYFVSVVVLR